MTNADEPDGSVDAVAPGVRRAPLQDRSQETVERILQAAGRLLGAGVSVAELTTTRIAQEADVSVGGLYRFFPDKQGIIDAIAVRRLEEFRAKLKRDVLRAVPLSGTAFLNATVDSFVDFLEKHPDFRTIAYGPGHISRDVRRQYAGPEHGGSQYVKEFMIDVLGAAPLPSLDLKIRVAAEAGDRLIAYAYEQEDPDYRARVIAELKALLAGYLFG
jgi:AcrR family transcriptional regulator